MRECITIFGETAIVSNVGLHQHRPKHMTELLVFCSEPSVPIPCYLRNKQFTLSRKAVTPFVNIVGSVCYPSQVLDIIIHRVPVNVVNHIFSDV